MRNAIVACARVNWLGRALLCALAVALAMLPGAVMGQVVGNVRKVEEDWELVIIEPSTDITAPQVTCLISPLNHLDGVYASLELNHGSLPDFSTGGLQLQAWSGESWLTVRDYADTTLHNNGEVVTWTMTMWVDDDDDDDELTFRVANGNSTSWGPFGWSGTFRLGVDSELANLNDYSPAVSAANSGVGFGSQRVQRLVLKRVRYYDFSNDLLFEDTTPRVVHEQ